MESSVTNNPRVIIKWILIILVAVCLVALLMNVGAGIGHGVATWDRWKVPLAQVTLKDLFAVGMILVFLNWLLK